MNIKEEESRDSVRVVWNVMPSTRTLQAKVAIPQALHYTPISQQLPNSLPYRPLQCAYCQSYMNPYNRIDTYNNQYTCCICKITNKLPSTYFQNKNNPPRQISLDYTSFITQTTINESVRKLGFLFVVDLCLAQKQLNRVKQSIKELIDNLDDQYRVGLISYNKVVSLFNFRRKISQVNVFSAGHQYSTSQIGEIIGLKDVEKEFLPKLKVCRERFNKKLESLCRIKAETYKHRRQLRATGQALNIALSLNQISNQVARVVLFCGGICTVGVGKVIGEDYKEEMRSIGQQTSKVAKEATQFYKRLQKKTLSKLAPIDSYIMSVQPVGLTQMLNLLTSTGGLLVQHQQFSSQIFIQSFKKAYLGLHDYPPLQTAFFSQLILSKSQEITITSINNLQNQAKGQQIIIIPLGGLNEFKTLTITYELSQIQTKSEAYYMQFKTYYYYGENINVKFERITTIRRLFGSYVSDFKLGFDQQAALVSLARTCIRRSLESTSQELILWLDNILCKWASSVAHYRKNDGQSFKLDDNMKNLPQFIYYLRRSSIVRKRGISLDEYNYINHIVGNGYFSHIISILQPAMIQYTLDNPQPKPIALDERYMKSQTLLLLDSFFNIVQWRGKAIQSLLSKSQQEIQQHDNVGDDHEIIKRSASDIANIRYDRFPIPYYYLTGVGHSKERFIKSKLGYRNVEQSQTNISQEVDIGTFTNKFIDLIVNKKI